MNKFATGSCWAISLFSIFAFYQHDCFFTMFQQGLPCLPQVTNWKQKNTALCTAKPAIYDHPLVLQKVVLKYRWSYNTGYNACMYAPSVHEISVVKTSWSLNAGAINGRFYCTDLMTKWVRKSVKFV